MTKKITKAVIPAAGIGSRFLPWTKAMPKEMLPIIDKPVIQYIVEECVEAGIEEIIIITDSRKRAIEDHFDFMPQLEDQLRKAGKKIQLQKVRRVAKLADFVYIRQKGPYGNGTPVLEAQKVVGNEPFVVLWGDQFIWAKPSRLKQCLSAYQEYNCPVFAGLKVDDERKKSSGIARVTPLKKNKKQVYSKVGKGTLYKLHEIVEKPGPENAPSDLMASGVYIFTPEIFPILAKTKPGRDGEIWLVDAINKLAKKRPCLVCEVSGGRFQDTGNKLSYHKTVIDFMLEDQEIGEQIKLYMQEKLRST
jgi:UTP--glucose-1-phosphate uridylyltransferase